MIPSTHHRKYLDRANEDNSNNARVSKQKNKGYIECVERGWIEEKEHPVAGYRFYTITASGKLAMQAPTSKKPLRKAKLKTLEPRISTFAPRLSARD